MLALFDYVNVTLVAVAVTFVLTLVFSQKIKDFLAGVPAELRAGLSTLEADIKADISNYQSTLIAKVSAVPTVPQPPAPAAPVVPLVPH